MSLLERKEKFEKVAFLYTDSLYNTALRLTREPTEAEDLVQDTYLRAYKFFHKFEEGTNFKAWIFKILKNTFINKYRKWKKTPYHVELEKVSFGLQSTEGYTESAVHPDHQHVNYDSIFDDDITEALDQLSEDFRTVILLTDVEGFSYKETAEIIDRPIGTVMSRLSRGRKMLRNVLSEYAVREGYKDSYNLAVSYN